VFGVAAGTARRLAPVLAGAAVLAAGGLLAGCGRGSQPAGERGGFEVVAAENFWGSIAAQLAGDRAQVSSIIVNPGTDPHSYEPTARDARAMADARMTIVNGLGYDGWAPRLLRGSPSGERVVLDVGRELGLPDGANPHQWYSPRSVLRVVDAIVAGYDRIEPGAASYFARRKRAFLRRGLARYEMLLRRIRARYAGTPVGYSESIFQPLGEALGLKLLTPPGFAKAISEGDDVTASDKQTVDDQVRRRQIAVWVLNAQNVTPDVQRVSEIARARGIPVATVTETLSPPGASFERWQSDQLEGLVRALAKATGR
jgi:zinc/manganese transport system substrate-binding protein